MRIPIVEDQSELVTMLVRLLMLAVDAVLERLTSSCLMRHESLPIPRTSFERRSRSRGYASRR